MGYLSQKKQQQRENIFCLVMMAVLTLLTAGSFAAPGFRIVFFNLFHLYCLSGMLFVYALWRQRYKTALFFTGVLLISYTILSSTTNLFLSDHFKGKLSLEFSFDDDRTLTQDFASSDILASGSVIFNRHTASYIVIRRPAPLTLMRVDFRKAAKNDYPQIFKQLSDFILTQDNPVIVFGEFGVPAWSKPFKHFLEVSGLTVKNRLLFTNGPSYNIFSTPGFYVLGFQDMGINDIVVRRKDSKTTVLIKASFNPALS